jgi:hypothetical protein
VTTATMDFSVLERIVGRQLVSASRIVYEFDGVVDVSCGDLELSFEGGEIVSLQCAADGERLTLAPVAWQDPFAPPLSPENEAFVQESGKYIRVDTNTAPPQLPVGCRLSRYVLIRNRFGTPAGVQLEFAGSAVRFLVECDEAYVMGMDDRRFTDWGFRADHEPSPAA